MFKFVYLCLGILVIIKTSISVEQEDDLQIVGSDNHYSYQSRYQQFNDRSRTPSPPGYHDITRYQTKKSNYDRSDVNYPVKTVQRYTDSDGNVKVITSYSNSDENPLPMYKDASVRVLTAPNRKTGYRGQYHGTKPPITEINVYTKPSMSPQPRSYPIKQEYSRTKTIRFPGSDGELVTKEHETTTRDGNSSRYNQQSSYNTRYKKPELRISSGYRKGKELNQPLQSAGTSYVSDVDDGLDDDGVSDYAGTGNYHNGGYVNHGYVGGISSHIPHGPIIPHVPIITHGPIIPHGPIVSPGPHGTGYGKEAGKAYSHSQHEEKGDKGGKGHKSHEVYHKGHSEKHGHEENKGGHVEESGEKTGHHDEENHYVKGHSASGGHKGTEKEHVKGHKKGHKTKGFRTVHHKDEYKKDEVFYDEEHDAGSNKNHGHDQASHKHTEGGKSKKGHLNSGYKDAQKGYHGDKEEGHSYDNSKGHAGHEGQNSHHSHHSHFSKGNGHKEGEAHGHGGQGYFR